MNSSSQVAIDARSASLKMPLRAIPMRTNFVDVGTEISVTSLHRPSLLPHQ